MEEKGEKKIQKPLSVSIASFKKDMVDIINRSGIPIYITEMVLKEMLNEVSMVSSQVQEKERTQYMESNQNNE